MAAAKITSNRDGTVTVRRERAVVHVDIRGHTLHESIDTVRYAALGVGIALSEKVVWDALRSDK